MKTFTLTAALLLTVTAGFAQKVKEDALPAPVKTAFTAKHPGVKVEKWEKEGTEYEAEFDLPGDVEMSESYDASGNLLQSETEIPVNQLPSAVSTYVSTSLGKKKIKEAAKITSAAGVVTYEAQVGGDDYIFDANGNFVKKESKKD